MNKALKNHIGLMAAGLAFLGSFGFFQFLYPYHLMRREQLSLFLWDWDYIGQTYKGQGWLARFAADFTDQFFLLPFAGPLVMALLLTGISFVAYRIARHFLGKWPSLGIAAIFCVWSFLRETGNLYCTRYTLVVLAYLALVLAALQFRKVWMKSVAAILFIGLGIWALGSPYNQYYGKLLGKPSSVYDKIIGIDTETARENWDKVIKLSREDLYMVEASYCYNLAHAMKGDLNQVLLNHSQDYSNGLLIWISDQKSLFSNCLAGEAWYHLGNMTLAEQSAIISLQASPWHTGARFIIRLARINLISGEYGTAQKYLNILSRTLFYRKWAREMLDSIGDRTMPGWVTEARKNLSQSDIVFDSNQFRPLLLELLEANPDNKLAKEYLLCLDLLCFDLPSFMEDLPKEPTRSHLYQEAVIIWLSSNGILNEENATPYGIDPTALDRMNRFFSFPANYKNTYWYYYLNEMLSDQ